MNFWHSVSGVISQVVLSFCRLAIAISVVLLGNIVVLLGNYLLISESLKYVALLHINMT